MTHTYSICMCMCTYRHVARAHEEARREHAHKGRVRGVVGREAQLEEHRALVATLLVLLRLTATVAAATTTAAAAAAVFVYAAKERQVFGEG